MSSTPHVVIIGGGFGGIWAARRLSRAGARVTLIDRRNHHLFQPLLYQVATAALTAPDIAYPIRRMFRSDKHVTCLLGEVIDIRRADRHVVLENSETVEYDYLIIAVGAVNNFFGQASWEAASVGLKSLDEALEIRRRVLCAFELAERETDPDARAALLTFVVVGAGPTGVEMAGALAEIARKTLARDFRRVNPSHARVVLVDAADRVLPGMPEDLSVRAYDDLDAMGVRIELNRRVQAIDDLGVTLGDDRIAARSVIWAAGVRAPALTRTLDTELDRAGRIVVTPTLCLPDDPRVFAIGDCAHFEQDGKALPGVAPIAIEQGVRAATNLMRHHHGDPPEAFVHRDKGSMATIGRARAVARIGRLHLTGRLAWWLWLLVHLMSLVGFRNRLSVLFQWAWAYVTYNRSARVILENPLRVRRIEGSEERPAGEL